MSSLGLYAGRRRKKPAQRSMKLEASQNAKSNPSKRHRDRLNTEMERLATLLPFPQDVISKLDKLSILRLSVSYLRAKNYFHAVVQKPSGSPGAKSAGNRIISPGPLKESELLLQALNGFVLVVTSDGLVFYVSHTIQDYLGFHQCDVIQQSIYELVHKDDREELRRNLHWAMNPQSTSIPSGEAEAGLPVTTYVPQQLPLENSSFLERQFVCRFRCLLDNSSGFLLLQIQGRLKFLRGQSRHTEDKGQASLQFALFALATPLQPPSILEIRIRNMIFRTKHKLDFTPLGCDTKATIILGYDEVELTMRGTGYQFIHAADMLHCAENHIRMMKTGETGLTFFRLLTKNNCWTWVQANAKLIYKNGQPDYIIATQRPLSNEEGDEQLRKRIRQFPFALTSSEALLYEGSGMQIGFESCNHDPKNHTVDPSSLLGAMMQQDHSIYVRPAAIEAKLSISHEMLGFSSSSVSSCVSPQGWQSPRSMEKSLLIKQESLVNDNLDSSAVIPDKLCEVLEILGLKSEDVENLHDNQFMQVSDFSDELLSNDDILSYIQDSLMKSDSLFLPGTNLPDISMQELEASLGQSKLTERPTQVEVSHESKSLAGTTTSSAQIPQDEHFVEENTFWSDTQFETKQCNPANVNPSIPTNTTVYNGNQQCVKGRSGNIPQVIGMQGPFLPPDYGSCQINNPAEHSKAMFFAQNESLQGKPFQRANECGTNLQMAWPTQIPGKVSMKFVNPINNQTTTQRHCAHNTNPPSFPVPSVHPDMNQTSLFAAQCTPVHALSQRLTLGAYQGPSQWAEQMQWQNTVGPSPLAPLYLSNEQPMQNQIWSRVANIIPSPVEASTVFPSMLCHQTPTNTPAYNWTNIPAPGGQNMQMTEMDSHPSCQFVGQEPGKINNYMSCPQAFPQQMLEPMEANNILGFPDNVHQNLEKRAVVSYSFTSNQCG